jgi:glycosyltransferase involved in cell wall biosynthesis
MERVRAVFVYANPRGRLAHEVEQGLAPDTGLLGQNHLAPLGIEATVHEPLLSNRRPLPFRLTWSARELVLPWELGDAAVVCTPLALLLPLAARMRGSPRALVLNMGLCARLRRAGTAQRRVLRTSLAAASGVVCFASAQREQLLAETQLPPDRVHVALFGVDERFFAAAPPAADGYVLAVGRDVARDYGTFARAVGGIGTRAVIVASARNLGDVKLPPNVEVQLDVSYPELRELYAGSSCVVVPTRAESYPYGADCSGHTVLLEAMAIGRPVVLSARSTNADYVRDGRTAVEVASEDPAALRDAIVQVLGDRELARSLGAAARAAVEERFTTRHFAQRLAPLIREAAGG